LHLHLHLGSGLRLRLALSLCRTTGLGLVLVPFGVQGWELDDEGVPPPPIVSDFNGVCAIDRQQRRVTCTCLANFYGPDCSQGACALAALVSRRPDYSCVTMS
jgi:hypothetical protein